MIWKYKQENQNLKTLAFFFLKDKKQNICSVFNSTYCSSPPFKSDVWYDGLNVFHHSFIGFSTMTSVSNRKEWNMWGKSNIQQNDFSIFFCLFFGSMRVCFHHSQWDVSETEREREREREKKRKSGDETKNCNSIQTLLWCMNRDVFAFRIQVFSLHSI